MKVLASHEGVALMSAAVVPPTAPAGLPEGTPFVCLVWNHASRVHLEWMSALARNLVRSGCQYFVCAGNGAEQLRDCIEEAVSEVSEEGRSPSDISWRPGASPAMTSWHVDEELEDVVFFFLTGTQESEWDASNFLIVHVGEEGDAEAPLEGSSVRLEVDEVAGRMFLEELLAEEES
jgi:hypothetical protein